MNNLRIKELVIIYGGVLLVAVFLLMMPSFVLDSSINSFSIDATDFSDGASDLTDRLRSEDEPIVNTYAASVSKNKLDDLADGDFGLVITRLWSEGYIVYWNGHDIGFSGDVVEGKANIWNSSSMFHIPDEFIEQENTLELKTHNQYDIGMFENSVTIASGKDAAIIAGRYQFFSELLTMLSLGISIFAIIISIVVLILNFRKHHSLLYIAFIILSLSIYSFDYLKLNTLPISYLGFKKIVIDSLIFMVLFGGVYATTLSKKKLPLIAGIIAFLIFTTGTIIAPTMLIYKKFYTYTLIMIPLCIVIDMIVLAPRLKKCNDAKIFFGGLVVFAIVSLWEVITTIFSPSLISSTTLPYIIILATMQALIITNETIIRNRELESEVSLKNKMYKKSITDDLTGLFSRQHCITLLKDSNPPFSVVMLDIDHFKIINDTHGHPFGDKIILKIASIMRQSLRDNDFIGRYGGDEFLLVLNCSSNRAFDICERIRIKVENSQTELGNKKYGTTVSIGIYHSKHYCPVHDMLENADIALYKAKENGRNCIVTFN